MRVKLLKDDKQFKIKKGDVFKAQRYRYDPDKITLLEREDDGFNPECNQYKESLAYWMQDRWFVLSGNKYMPLK
jgi:hypothetical protein